jgi:hypothetical protein
VNEKRLAGSMVQRTVVLHYQTRGQFRAGCRGVVRFGSTGGGPSGQLLPVPEHASLVGEAREVDVPGDHGTAPDIDRVVEAKPVNDWPGFADRWPSFGRRPV